MMFNQATTMKDWEDEACLRSLSSQHEGTFYVHTTASRPKLVVDGRGMVNQDGSRLLAGLAVATSLTGAFTDALRRLRPRAGSRPIWNMLADGGWAATDW
ncbi:hypothetical protein ACFYWN_43345 [Streptomyces sp. NPDC002917]|uniref:hypothetical protein n=1 Tax=Streptomyces sp. NPDC002917 TaxID=3364671 RepID=UPI00367BCE3D